MGGAAVHQVGAVVEGDGCHSRQVRCAALLAQVSGSLREWLGRDLGMGAFGAQGGRAAVCALEGDCWFGPAPHCCPSCHPRVGEDFGASCPPAVFRGVWGPRQ